MKIGVFTYFCGIPPILLKDTISYQTVFELTQTIAAEPTTDELNDSLRSISFVYLLHLNPIC